MFDYFFFSGSCCTIQKFTQSPPSSVQRDFWAHSLNKTLEMFPSVLVEGIIVSFVLKFPPVMLIINCLRICPGEFRSLDRQLALF